MAAASSFASAALPELKIKPKIGSVQFLRSNSSSFPCLIRVFSDKINTNNASIKGLPFLNPGCEAASVRNGEIESKPKASSFSALELLKTSAADRYTKERSSIMVVGLNIHTATVDIREKLSIQEGQMASSDCRIMCFESYRRSCRSEYL